MSTVVNKIESILTSEYSTANYVELMQEIFDTMKLVAPNNFRQEFSNFSTHIVGRAHIGNYTTPDGKRIAIFSVQLKKENYVESSRSTQRSYAKKLIESGNCDAAIVAFYTEGEPKWRLSFVRLDYEMKIEQGKLKTKENITPAKRYSFLVGKDEPCHTAIDRFRQFIIDKNSTPSLDELEDAFSVEKVTKEFFDLYCEKFYQLQEFLESSEDFVEESRKCGFTSEQYAKKLMGQIVFLYFLQKKGWLGVGVWATVLTEKEYKNLYYVSGAQGRIIKEHLPKLYIQQADGSYRLNSKALDLIPDDEEEVIANHMTRKKTWGDGSKKFLRTIFDFSKTHKRHFFENYLEPLFYDTLNKNRGAMGYCPSLHCRIPFLSGGLFEPLDGYDWKSNNFDIPDEIFSNKKDANDRNADGILDIFDRYNFTMSEDEPMEREVAIDPEMLGKIFENLLEVKDRKSKGAFYTPREIVHYMCQESLINYLVRKTTLPEADIRDFILYGDFMKDEDTVKSKREGNGGMYISDSIFKIDENGSIAVNRLKDIDNALATVRVADPAVGSGAFPLGMVNEIVRARENISAYITIGMNPNDKRLLYKNERSPYMLKLNAIRNSIFAVDIEPSAVDITQLRLWLSLVIDDEITPDAANDLEGHKNPLPLPNLECNILCGNSLIEEFKGIKLIKESELINNMTDGLQLDLGHAGFEAALKQLLKTQDQLFYCDEPNRKAELKKQIQSLKDMIISAQLQGVSQSILDEYELSKTQTSKPYILWHLEFARVFRDNGGFDIVIGNPPYLESRNPCFSEETKDELQSLIKKRYEKKAGWFPRGADLLIYFFELSLRLIRKDGINTFITQNSWLDTEFGRKFQDYLLDTTNVLGIVDSDFKYFETADINTVITFFEGNEGCSKPILFARCHKNLKNYPLPIGKAKIDSDSVTYKVLQSDNKLLKEMKWGFIFGTNETLFNIIAKANRKGKCVTELSDFDIGQGLNLKKSNIIDKTIAETYRINDSALIPFYITEEGARYNWYSTTHYLVSKNKLSSECTLPKEYDRFDETATRKTPPVLILPRGIGARHFCCYNAINGFSSSCVDVYSTNGTKLTDDVLRIWLYMNSSLFWLIREISGRKNLGGGMLKAEAVDIKSFAIFFNFDRLDEIRELFDTTTKDEIMNAPQEIFTEWHKTLDNIVFDYLELTHTEREFIISSLLEAVNARYSKTKN